MRRRPIALLLLIGLLLAGGCQGPAATDSAAAPPDSKDVRKPPMSNVRVRVIDADGRLTGPIETPRLVLNDTQWHERLTHEQFRITRGKDTERAFCGGLLANKESGMYVCVCCNLPLFESASKFESGTGWPSFFQPAASENIREESDLSGGRIRTEILCRRCDAHLGHVFDDGPPPTGRRYCLNSDAMRFVPTDQLALLAEVSNQAQAVFAGGCFWCVEAVFRQLDGVLDVTSGYAGGSSETANYETVSTGRTGHAESVRIVYDPRRISFETLLNVHFATHDPTSRDRQGNDVGPQYRSAIFYADEREKKIAEAAIARLNESKIFHQPVVTTLEPLVGFYPAEAKHQNYVACHLDQSYIREVAIPKVEKTRAKFKELIKPSAGK